MKRKPKNRDKYDSFSEFILNDDTIVLKVLMTIAKWFGALFFSALAWLMFDIGIPFLGVVFGALAVFGWHGVYKFHTVGTKDMKGFTAANMVWDKDYIKVGKKK